MDTKGLKKGDKVGHVMGGTGILTGHFENDWSTDPPTVRAQCKVRNTIFHDVRMLDIGELFLLDLN